jgi:hypothetical protein
MITVKGFAVPVVSPLQPENRYEGAGVAVT